MKNKIYIIMLLAIVFQMTSCVKEIIEDRPVSVVNLPPQEVIVSSFYGQVTDEDGNAINGAEISIQNGRDGVSRTSTDESGNFQFLDVTIEGHYANLKIIADGMWDINKTVLLLKNKTSRVDIVCQSKEITKIISNTENSIISIQNDIELHFQAGSIGTIDGDNYTGEVKVFARSIVKGQENYEKMGPGYGWGLDKDNEVARVIPSITLEVDLFDENGNPLQIKENQAVIARLKIPEDIEEETLESSMLHLNESLFVWDERAKFIISNGYIEVEIPHFSTWSWCQILNLKSSIKGKLSHINTGNTIDALHYVTLAYEPVSFYVPTATDGTFFMPFAIGSLPFTMIVQNECEEIVYMEDYPAINTGIDTDLGTIEINSEELSYSSLTIEVMNCDSTWVENGYASLSFDGLTFKRKEIIPIVNGSLNYSFLDCEDELTGTLFMLNEENLLTTEPIEINLNNGDVDLGLVMLCDTFKSFMEIIVDGNQIIRNHRVTWGCTSNGDGEQITGLKDEVAFQTAGYWSGPGDYVVSYGSFSNLSSDVKYTNKDIVFTITEFEPNEEDPSNVCWRPKVLIGTFTGTAKELDKNTGAYIKDVSVTGSFEYL